MISGNIVVFGIIEAIDDKLMNGKLLSIKVFENS
jgi:hypothetical protein